MEDVKRFLFSEAGKAYLTKAYVDEGKSLRQIALALESYAMQIERAMAHHDIPRREQYEARDKAIEEGRVMTPERAQQRFREEEEARRFGHRKVLNRLSKSALRAEIEKVVAEQVDGAIIDSKPYVGGRIIDADIWVHDHKILVQITEEKDWEKVENAKRLVEQKVAVLAAGGIVVRVVPCGASAAKVAARITSVLKKFIKKRPDVGHRFVEIEV